MKEQLKLKENESLDDWVNRIADYWNFGEELRETLHTIATESYNRGIEHLSIEV